MSEAIATTGGTGLAPAIEQVLVGGDLSQLTTEQRLQYYSAVCNSLKLNPLTRPFEYLLLDSPGGGKKLTLYARKDATDQLRNINGVSITSCSGELVEGVYVVTASATDMDGRVDIATGAVALEKEGGEWKSRGDGKRFFQADGTVKPLTGEARANAMMKAETKAKRRVTLSLCGLGMLDETEVETIHGAQVGEPPAARTVSQPQPRPQPVDVKSEPMPAASDFERLAAAREKAGTSKADLKAYVDERFHCAVTKMNLMQLNVAVAWLQLPEEGNAEAPAPFPGVPEEAWLEIAAAFHDGEKVTSEEAYGLIDDAEDVGWQGVAAGIQEKLGVALKDLPGGKPLELLTAALQAFGPKKGGA